MKRSAICGFLVPLLLIASSATGQSALIHQQMQQTYNFQPHLLNKQQIDQASVVLDHFWTKAKTERSQYVPALRQELSDFKNSPFFLYDGSMLLLSLSDSPIDRKSRSLQSHAAIWATCRQTTISCKCTGWRR